MKVYAATIWWADSDPLVTIVTKTSDKTRKLALKYMKGEAEYAYENDIYDSLDDAESSIRWTGVSAFDLKTLTVSKRDYASAVEDLKNNGVAYLG